MSLAFQITATGASAPDFAAILASLQDSFRAIYGADAYLEPDSQDGQLLAIIASAVNDANMAAVALYNAFSPATAIGAGLSSVVKINGLRRISATNSTAILVITGTVGTVINAGSVRDASGNIWDLPAVVTVPLAGFINVTATCRTAGAVTAAIAEISVINTPTLGWQSASNPAAATPGQAAETDAELRQRQAISTSLPAQTPLQAILGAVANVAGVGRHAIYENNTSTTDGDGIPGHSIAVVVEGGDAQAIADVIGAKKAPGTGTHGSVVRTVVDPAGVPLSIRFFQLTERAIYVNLTIQPLTGYVASTGQAIKDALAAFINTLKIGEEVRHAWMYTPASLLDTTVGQSFKVTALTIGFSAGTTGTADLTIAFNEAAKGLVANIALTVL